MENSDSPSIRRGLKKKNLPHKSMLDSLFVAISLIILQEKFIEYASGFGKTSRTYTTQSIKM